jgi:putative phage-type endonuclease
MNKSDWLKERQNGIGGSEASAVLGMNPYMTNVELWEYKTGRKQRQDKDSQYMKYGREAERPLIELFRLDYWQYETKIPEPYTLQRNKEYPFILGTVDAELLEKEEMKPQGEAVQTERKGIRKGFLEVKTTNIMSSSQEEQWNDRVPLNYYIQCLHYMLVNEEYEYFYLKAQLKSIWQIGEVRLTTKHYYFERKDLLTKHYYFEKKDLQEDLKLLKDKELEFWQENVKKDKKPSLILPPL